ncbi:hypothetical protein L6R29_18940 [Myxococcota bacterium]|nr:hypothetical protein [Myxococcota bacterium]
MISQPPSSQSFVWCGALQSAWSQRLLHRLLSDGWAGQLDETRLESSGFSPSGLSNFVSHLTDAERAQLGWVAPQHQCQKAETPDDSVKTPSSTTAALLFWEIPCAQDSDLRTQSSAAWSELFAAFAQLVSLLRSWEPPSPALPTRQEEAIRHVFLLWPEQATAQQSQEPWPTLVERWSRLLAEQWALTLEQHNVCFLSLPSGIDIHVAIEKINARSSTLPLSAQADASSSAKETQKMQRLHAHIHRILGALRGLLLHFRAIQNHIERFGFLRRQRLAQRFYKLSGLRLLDWETQIHRMITGWSHLLQVHDTRLLPSFMRDRLQADQKIAQRLRQLLSSLLHFPQEQDAPQKDILTALHQDRDALFSTIQRFLRDLDQIDTLWKEYALAA